MFLRLPASLHYPITVTSLLKQPGDPVQRDEALFWYVYQTIVTEGDGLGNKVEVKRSFPTKFESTVDGEIVRWNVTKGDVIDEPVDVVEIDEPCAHEVQFGGLCAECGKDMTEATYNTEVMDSMRAPIKMVHDNTTLTVSEREATRVEEDAKRRLLASRKLSLVVDLDQTIIHATVDPTVGEWMEDKDNPNHQYLNDVRAFQLVDDGPGMRGCWYYIKLRPGLQQFLENVAKIYELHIYTMGTRAYAQSIANIVDPDRTLFGDRILSRDESGSLTAKNLQRLFPVDTKMVVIIDDRGDVWRWNPNLIKVSPYDFFVGIGDINSSFLPKKQELENPNKPIAAKAAAAAAATDNTPPEHHVNGTTIKPELGGISALEQLVTMGGGDNPRLLQEQATAQEETIMHQVEDRPLLQKQKELDAEDEAADRPDSSQSVDESQDLSRQHRHHLLEDNDRELYLLQERLQQVHRNFYEEYDRKRSRSLGGRVAALRGEKTQVKEKDVDLKLVPDVKDVMPQIKRQVLGGVVMVFSGVLPLGTDMQNADISLWAKSFGAVLAPKITSRTTHLVAGRNRTAKVREATRYLKIKIVTTQWLVDSLTQWKRLDETPYLLPVHPDDRGEPISPDSKEAAESAWLSTTDDETKEFWTEDEGEGMSESTNEIFKSTGLTEVSPIGYDADQQAAVHEELKEFLGSDDESESETEAPGSEQQQPPVTPSKKRKRGDTDEEGDEEDQDQDQDIVEEKDQLSTVPTGGEGGEKTSDAHASAGGGSRLAQRIRRSYERSTSLKEVATASSSSPGRTTTTITTPSSAMDVTDTPTPDDGDGGGGGDDEERPDPGAASVTYPEDEDDELEREMLAALEDGDYDEMAEGKIAAENG
ncbi:hypothetical protein ASPZODRAFT_138657 [Penicilliopsis zonata CBS 506.65]|uniref:RNA polymerase II subunit A C-terminal domain phosphatase n=1 Tax=Penicilliopsis zonata CBS 506.65 TaxID=1073090 RepID=A0A1L9SWN5_9EURO|nr:hypothetical protein ASPZODRAFT_138657 [Penicilliopsis zonata CBS 506.65]OJJ51576.1 hypothetical protein ASPZODRAFT_138657 [Penicilliopsis zonata CBS 506.65]